jgi:LAO/AO transport system kinase
VSKQSKHTSALQNKEGVPTPESVSEKAVSHLKEQRKKAIDIDQIITQILNGNEVALSRGITLIESTAAKHQAHAKLLIESCLPKANMAVRIGITGVPGVGKSTFIESFGKLLISQGKKVAVLAVDPSSTISKGSILGDKTRMDELVKEKNAFIRPSASGESLGGVARKTREAIILCEAAGFDTILIETVGVGQSETAVHSMTDFFLLLKLAGAGDELQGIKRGIIEMADAIVINKADGENLKAAKIAKSEFNRALHLYPPKEGGWVPKTLTCSAIKNEGIDDILTLINAFVSEGTENGTFQKKRNNQNKFWLLQTIENRLKSDFFTSEAIQKELKIQLAKIESHETTPFEAAETILSLR